MLGPYYTKADAEQAASDAYGMRWGLRYYVWCDGSRFWVRQG